MFLKEDEAAALEGQELELNEEAMLILDREHDAACRSLEAISALGEGAGIVGKYKVKKEVKIKRMVARAANIIAKQAGDPLYQKMLFHYLHLKQFRAAIQKKYGLKAKQQVKVYLTHKHSPLASK